ncbi:oligosaccharide flippase family protein [Acinetobacter johnsonii]|uniref:oligosaccharide flippase family protein n=1 Tax=Acinetobacter johnsonii TaxID=40214 RepID=UPI002168E0DE|nr:oligosaccharide flippase family protein [Acinetobacter johnsonii]MCS3527631.1 PST family polysaccharide transporter [Acinetobacter johnsonii]
MITLTQYKPLIKNFLYLFLARGLDLIIPLVLLPMLVNRLGMENYGLIAMSLSLALYLGTIIQYGFNLSGTREIAQVENDCNKLNIVFSQYFQTSHILGLVVTFFSFLILSFIKMNETTKILYISAVLYILFYSLIPIWLFQGLEKFKVIALLTSFSKILYVLGVYFLVINEKDIIYVNFLNFISVFILYLISLLYIFKFLNLRFKIIKIQESYTILKRDFYVFLNQIVPNFYNNFSVFYLGIIAGSFYAGLISSAMTLIEGVLSIFRILVNVIYPFLVKNINLFDDFSKKITLIIIFGFLLFNVLVSYVVSFIFHNNENEILFYTRILGVSIIFGSLYLLYGMTYSLIKKTEKKIALMVFKVSLFSAILMLAIAPIYKIYAVIFVIVFARFLFAFFSLKNYFGDKRLLNDK